MLYLFSVMVGLASLAVSLLLATRRLKTAEERIANAVARKQAQVERIKKIARTTLHQAQDLRSARRRKDSVSFSCDELEQRLQAAGAVERRLYVLDDRRTQTDLGWIVKLMNTEYAGRVNADLEKAALQSWKRGRRFQVWALDEKKAKEKINARYPEQRGFVIAGIEAYQG